MVNCDKSTPNMIFFLKYDNLFSIYMKNNNTYTEQLRKKNILMR